MRSKSQQLMNEISAYVDRYYSERHTAPSVNEIAKGVGIAKTTSYRYLVAMNDLGILRYDGASRTITTRMISKFSESTVPAPVVGARVKRISHSFDERIANEPKVSLRDGHYVVFDGQHVVAARVDKNSGEELPICCKVYSDLTEQEEAKLFANQSGFGVPPSIGMKLRALVFAGDPEAVSFLKTNEEIGLRIDYGQHKGRKRVACIAAALTEYRKLGPEKYQEAMKMILDGWDCDPDSLRVETVTGVCRFVDLYSGEFDPKRVVKRFRTVDPLKIYRDGRAMGDNFPG